MERARPQSQPAPLRGAVSRPKRLHREVEQKRRMRVAQQIALLRSALCDAPTDKSDTVSVLQRAVRFVNVAQSTIANLQAENAALRRDAFRVPHEWGSAAAAAAAAATAAATAANAPTCADELGRDGGPTESCLMAAVSSGVSQRTRDCCVAGASRTAAPWAHAPSSVTYHASDRGAPLAAAPSPPHASLPRFDALRQYPQQQQPFGARAAHHCYSSPPQLLTQAPHAPPSGAQRSVSPLRIRHAHALAPSSGALSRARSQAGRAAAVSARCDGAHPQHKRERVPCSPRDSSNP